MARHGVKRKPRKHRKNPKRVAAGREAWRTRRRKAGKHAARRSGVSRRRHVGGRKRTGRVAAGKRLARYNALARKIGKRRAHAKVFG